MLHKIFIVLSLLLLFVPAVRAATESKNDSVTHKPTSDHNFSEKSNGKLGALLPLDNASPTAGHTIEFSWTMIAMAAQYRLEIDEVFGNATPQTAMLSNVGSYRMPPAHLHGSKDLRWRVVALDSSGNVMAETGWRILLSPSSECEK